MIELQDISVTFGDTRVIAGLDLKIERGEFFTLLGPSGCGKTTLLRVISGFVGPSAGRVVIAGQDVTHIPPEDRSVGVVFQNYALFPHLSVFDNVAFGLRMAGVKRADIRARVTDALERIGVAGHAQKKPADLSGGQQQRVAIARALILGSQVLLLDEPLSNLDAKLRDQMRDEIRDIQERAGLTIVYVTHDQHEALALSDRIAVMNAGAVEQLGTPRMLYDRPAREFVCTFVGDISRLPPHPDLGADETAYIRPEHVQLTPGGPGALRFEATLARVIYQGARQRIVLRAGGADIAVEAPADLVPGDPGAPRPFWVDRMHLHLFPKAAS